MSATATGRTSARSPEPVPRVGAAMALFPLRLFLGVTFVYAGIQKLSDPGFLHPGAPTYIGTQLHAFANGTPGGFLLRAFALPAPKLSGVLVALVEIAVGLLVTAGLLTRAAAAVGLLLNLVLFLTNSWKTTPYFLGSDIVFVFAWLPFVLSGSDGQPALDSQLDGIAASRRRGSTRGGGFGQPGVSRRAVLMQALGVTGLLTLALGGLSALAKGSYKSRSVSLGGSGGSATKAPAATAATPAAKAPTSGSVPAGAVKLGSSTQLPQGQSAIYNDPHDGQPDIVIRQPNGKLTAFTAVCTHAGCTVGYEGGQIVCPCHGGVYNAQTGAVEGGPPPAPLEARHVVESGGLIYAVPS